MELSSLWEEYLGPHTFILGELGRLGVCALGVSHCGHRSQFRTRLRPEPILSPLLAGFR